MPSRPNRVPVAREPEPRRDGAGVVFGRKDAVPGHYDRGKPEPLRARRTVDGLIQPGVIHEDLKAAAVMKPHQTTWGHGTARVLPFHFMTIKVRNLPGIGCVFTIDRPAA